MPDPIVPTPAQDMIAFCRPFEIDMQVVDGDLVLSGSFGNAVKELVIRDVSNNKNTEAFQRKCLELAAWSETVDPCCTFVERDTQNRVITINLAEGAERYEIEEICRVVKIQSQCLASPCPTRLIERMAIMREARTAPDPNPCPAAQHSANPIIANWVAAANAAIDRDDGIPMVDVAIRSEYFDLSEK